MSCLSSQAVTERQKSSYIEFNPGGRVFSLQGEEGYSYTTKEQLII